MVNTLQKLAKLKNLAQHRLLHWRILRSYRKTKHKREPSPLTNSHQGFYCAYIYLPKLQEEDITLLFSEDYSKLKSILSNCLLFLDKNQAFEYSRFMSDNGTIVKLYITEASIMCHNQKLTLRQRGLKNAIVNGFYLLHYNESAYIKNPHFEDSAQQHLAPINYLSALTN